VDNVRFSSVSKRVVYETSSILANTDTQSVKRGTKRPVVEAVLGMQSLRQRRSIWRLLTRTWTESCRSTRS